MVQVMIKELSISKNTVIPKYCQLKDQIKDQIIKGKLKEGVRLPSESQLCSFLGLSRNTVRQAVNELVSQGLVYREQGKGTFVQSSTYRKKQSYNKNVALFLNSMSSSSKSGDMGFYGDLLEKLHEHLNKENFNVKHYFLKDKDLSKLSLNNYDIKNMLGAIFVGEYSNDNKNLFKKIPTIFIDYEMRNKNVISIVSKNVSGGKEATRYLIGIGLRKIGFIGYNQPNYKLRYQGYCEALNAAKIPVNSKIVWFNFYEACRNLKKEPSLVDALFCCQDYFTLEAVNFLHKSGFSIPDDISIISYDDTDVLAHIEPAITSISVDRDEMARKAVYALKETIKSGKTLGKVIKVSTKLIVRDSCKKT